MRKNSLNFSLEPVNRTSITRSSLGTHVKRQGNPSITLSKFPSSKDKRLKNFTCRKLNDNLMKFHTQVSPIFEDFSILTPDYSRVNTSMGTVSHSNNLQFSQSKEVKSIIARIAKCNIVTMKKQSLKRKLSEKFRRFNFRQRKNELMPVKKTWIVLGLALGLPFVMFSLVCNKKDLKLRAKLRLDWFRRVCSCIGKMRIYLKRAKIVCAIKTITRCAKYARAWLARTRGKYVGIIADVSEIAMKRSVYYTILALFNMKILKVQRWVKSALRNREALYEDLLKLWAEKEIEMFRKIGKKNKSGGLSTFRINIVHEGKKLVMIKEKVKEIMKEYSLMKKKYLETFDKYESLMKDNVFNTQEVFDMNFIKPKVPNIRKWFLKNDGIRQLIHKALTERSSVRSRRK